MHRTPGTRTSWDHNTLSEYRPRCPVAGHEVAQLLEVTRSARGTQLAALGRMELLEMLSSRIASTSPLDRELADGPDASTDMPRERLLRLGARALGDIELLAIILGTGVRDRPVLAVAGELVNEIGGVAALSRASPHELAQVHGVGLARAARFAAAFELGRRAVELVHHRATLTSSEDVYRAVASRFSGLTQEVVLVIGLDIRNGVLDIVEVGRGGVGHVQVEAREVFRPLIRMAAAGGILVHNHTSGDPAPSTEDREMTERLREAGRFLGIPLIDHVVVSGSLFCSIAEWMGVDF
jgi:DNA repair protein RadC